MKTARWTVYEAAPHLRAALQGVAQALTHVDCIDGCMVLANILCRGAVAAGIPKEKVLGLISGTYDGALALMATQRGGDA
jgi:hypothetical protein